MEIEVWPVLGLGFALYLFFFLIRLQTHESRYLNYESYFRRNSIKTAKSSPIASARNSRRFVYSQFWLLYPSLAGDKPNLFDSLYNFQPAQRDPWMEQAWIYKI